MNDYSKFSKEVLEFLQTKYGDAYTFKIECNYASPKHWRPEYTLDIKISPSYTIRIANDYFYHLYDLYEAKVTNTVRNLHMWKVKLIEIVEG